MNFSSPLRSDAAAICGYPEPPVPQHDRPAAVIAFRNSAFENGEDIYERIQELTHVRDADARIDAVGTEPHTTATFHSVVDRVMIATFTGTDRPHVPVKVAIVTQSTTESKVAVVCGSVPTASMGHQGTRAWSAPGCARKHPQRLRRHRSERRLRQRGGMLWTGGSGYPQMAAASLRKGELKFTLAGDGAHAYHPSNKRDNLLADQN